MSWQELVDEDLVCVCTHSVGDHADDLEAECLVCDCSSFEEEVGQ